MLTSFQHSALLLVSIATLPAIISWWSGRRLAGMLDDPILPERLVAHQRRNGAVLILAIGGLAAVAARSLAWTLPLAIVALHAGAFPLRKALFAETWTFGAYLSFFGRLYFGLFGFWILLAATPSLAARAGSADWLAGVLLAATLLAWNLRYARVVRLCLRTRPLEESPFLTRCRALAEMCGLPQPGFERLDLRGGVLANALALPSFGGSSVLFTNTLLERLRDDEAAAICAHELAHLEYYHPQRLRRMNVLSLVLIALAGAWAPAARLAGLTAGGWTATAWLGLLAAALLARARGKQRQETLCDVRAVGLVGAEPLIAALTKLYTIARIPRRVELQHDQSGSHPSLARRIRDIRKAAGAPITSLASPAAFTSADGRTTVTFEAGTLHWLGSDAITQSVEYGHLTELRIDARRSGAPRLVIRGQQTRRWEMMLAPPDLARAQAVLDVVDSRLGDMPAAPAIPFRFSRPLVAVVTLMAFMLGQIAVAIVAAMACIRVATPLLVAAGAAALTAAALATRTSSSQFVLLTALPLAAAGFALLALAWSNRAQAHRSIRPMLGVLAVLAVLAVASIALGGIDAVRLHESARATASATVWVVALAGALGCSQVRRSRIAGLGLASIAALIAFVGSSTFLDRVGSDPFLVQGPAIKWVSVDGTALDEFALPAFTSRLRMSPDGAHVAALAQSDGTDDDVTPMFHVGRAGDTLRAVPADDAVFVDNEHLLIAAADRRGTTVQKIRLDDTREVVWQQRVEDLVAPSLSIDRHALTWRLTGWTGEHGLARAEGAIGAADVEHTRWPVDPTSEAMVAAFTTTGREALVVESRYDAGIFDDLPPRWRLMLVILQRFSQESRYWRLNPDGRTDLGVSRLGADCHAGVVSPAALVCVTFDGTRSRIFTLDMTGRIQPLGSIIGRFSGNENAIPGWLSGWIESTPAAIRLSTGEAFRLPAGPITHVSATDDRLAVVTIAADGPMVRTYRVERLSQRGTRAKRQ